MNKNDREYVAHMAATIFAGKEVTIKQAVHTACRSWNALMRESTVRLRPLPLKPPWLRKSEPD